MSGRKSDAVTITHPEKVLFPDDGITKGDLAAYYEAIAPVMIPHIRGRPITMERYNKGIGEEGFIQKNVSKGYPDWLERVAVPKQGGTVHHPLVEDKRSLLWLANQNCITPHVWVSRARDLYHPDVCVFDLDPSVEDMPVLREATLAIRDVLDELGLPSWVKASGSKGFHVLVPLDGKTGFDGVSGFANGVARVMIERQPDRFTQEFSKADRGDRIYLDTGRNNYSATFSAVYAVRPKPGAPISAPCTWQEIEDGTVEPQTFTMRGMAERIESVGDLWADMLRRGRSLRQPAARLRKLLGR